jgi:hypothetical protein
MLSGKEAETADIFHYKDPRLQHLKADFRRSKLMPENISFVHNQADYYHALDEIIKHNCYNNEFNYMLEFY